jgi:predicted dehydrogenase
MSDKHDKDGTFGRRDLLRTFSAAAVAGLSGSKLRGAQEAGPGGSMIGQKFEPRQTVRMALIGAGGRGSSLLKNFLAVDGVQVVAVCDVIKDAAARARATVEKAGGKAPATYSDGDHDYERLLTSEDIDFAVIATPWNWHTPMALFTMQHGKHAAVEVPAALTLDECWDLVKTSEQTRKHCMMLENACYGYNELLLLNMVRAGVLGELTHGAAAYDHDLRSLLVSNKGEGLWRREWHLKLNGNLYPTHGLGPVARYMSVNRGDRFERLVSMSSPARGLAAYRDSHLPADDPKRREVYRCGDQNTSLIRTAKGLLITLEHNVTSPEPYDRINMIAGTKGIFRGYPPRIFIDGQSKGEEFESVDGYKTRYEHPLWTKQGELAKKLGGHGGMDFLMCYRVAECIKQGLAPDMDVYDAAALSAPGPLSVQSVASGSAPAEFPDFTRGAWRTSPARS